MHEQIDRLAGLVSNMQVEPSSSSSGGGWEATKRRKLSVKGSGVVAPLLWRQSSTDSTMMISEYEAAGAELLSGSELLGNGDGDFFFDIKEEKVEKEQEGMENQQDDVDEMNLFSEAADLLMEGDDLPTPVSPLAPHAHVVPQMASHQKQQPVSASVVSSLVAEAPTAAAIEAVSAAASDIGSVLDGLSPELRLRFVDRLAEVMGAQLTQSIAQQVQVQVHVSQQQQQPQVQLYVPYTPAAGSTAAVQTQTQTQTSSSASSSSAYPLSSDPAHFRLPSGSKAPEIAIPLASAAIAALLSSMQAFAHNPQLLNQRTVVIKEEVVCK